MQHAAIIMWTTDSKSHFSMENIILIRKQGKFDFIDLDVKSDLKFYVVKAEIRKQRRGGEFRPLQGPSRVSLMEKIIEICEAGIEWNLISGLIFDNNIVVDLRAQGRQKVP